MAIVPPPTEIEYPTTDLKTLAETGLHVDVLTRLRQERAALRPRALKNQ
jgi:hypothetical protein